MLPKIEYPIFTFILPSTKKTIEYRPFTVKEEKLLLIAGESEDISDQIRAMRQVVNNCCLNLETDIGLLPQFDLEFAFLKIRSKSVSNEVELKYKDKVSGKVYSFIVDLDEIEITEHPGHSNIIQLTEDVGVIMKYPTLEMLTTFSNKDITKTENLLEYLEGCIESIFDSNQVYDVSIYSKEELMSWLESIPRSGLVKVVEFFETMPELKHDLVYTDVEGIERTIALRGIDDFFQ